MRLVIGLILAAIIAIIMTMPIVGLIAGRYGHCDVGFAAIDWLRGIESRCDFSSRYPRP